MDPVQRARRRRLRDAYTNAERAARTALLIIDRGQLTSLVEYVEGCVGVEGCDHTRRHARQWARDQGFDWPALCEGLDEFGGFCDCEVVANCDPVEVFG
jgi:hypothetical protein